MIYASVCSGVEAASLAWMPLGWKTAWFSEIEPFPCAVLKHRFPEVPNLGDMTKIKVETIENETGKLQRFKNSGADVVVPGGVDLLVGGTPCQGFSVAGKQDGLDDPRSALCLAYCELLETMRPRWFVWENVPGVLCANQGDDFRAFLRKIDEIGYSVAWRMLDAQYVRVDGYPRAVPQRRRRVFVVGHLGDWRYPASVLFEPGCLPGDTPPRRSKGSGVARSLTASTGGASGKEQQCTFISGDGRLLNALGVDGYNGAISGQVSATVDINCKNVNGPTLVMANGQANSEVSEAFSPALTCDHESPIVCAGFSGGQGEKAGGIGYEDDVAPTIRSAESGSNQVPDVICQYGDVAENIIGRKENTGANGTGAQVELAYTQNATGVMGVSVNTSVRRLLPVECERLMGFPDRWTRIPWRSKPEEKCPDAPRYKACGNSMCVNVMRWIGMRIELTERKLK